MMYETQPLLQLVYNCYQKAREQRTKDITIPHPLSDDEITEPWWYYDRIYRGYHWDLFPTMATWVSRPVFNKPFIGVEANTTLLTDSRPSIAVTAREETDTDLAEIVQAAVEYWWQLQMAQTKISVAVKGSRVFGLSWIYLYHGPNGQELRVVHPESIMVDPDTTVEEFDPGYLVYEYRSSLGELRRRFPDVDDEIWMATDEAWQMGMPDRVQADRFDDVINPAKYLTVVELWMKDDTYIEYDDTEIVEGKVTKLREKKYKNGYRVVTVAGGREIDDTESPYEHGQVPFTPIHCYPVPGRFYSMGDIQQVFPLVIMRNRYQQYLYDQTLKSGGGIILVGQGAGIKPDVFTNVPIQIIPCKDPSQVVIQAFPAPSRHIMDALAEIDKAIDDVLGLHEQSRGVTQPGNRTAQEVAILAESDRTRIRLASRLLADAITRVANQLVMNWAQWGDFTWMLRLSNKENPEMADIYSFSGEDLKRERQDMDTGKFTTETARFDLKVGETSMLPGSRSELRQLADSGAQAGFVGGLDWLKINGWPNPEATFARSPMGQQQQAAQQQPQQQLALPPGAMPPQGQMPPEMMGGEQEVEGEEVPPEAMAQAEQDAAVAQGGGLEALLGGMMPGAMPPEMMPQGQMPPEMAGGEEEMLGNVPPGASGDISADFMAEVEDAAERLGLSPEQVLELLNPEGGRGGALL